MSDIEIRLAHASEYETIGRLTVASYRAEGYLTLADGAHNTGYAEWLGDGVTRGRDSCLLVAVEGDTLLGTTTWCPPGSPYRELATDDSQGEFRTLAVSSAARGRGVGRALVQWCIDEAVGLQMTEMVLCSLPQMVPAHRLYRSMGFVRREDLDWTPFDGVHLWGFSLSLDIRRTVEG